MAVFRPEGALRLVLVATHVAWSTLNLSQPCQRFGVAGAPGKSAEADASGSDKLGSRPCGKVARLIKARVKASWSLASKASYTSSPRLARSGSRLGDGERGASLVTVTAGEVGEAASAVGSKVAWGTWLASAGVEALSVGPTGWTRVAGCAGAAASRMCAGVVAQASSCAGAGGEAVGKS